MESFIIAFVDSASHPLGFQLLGILLNVYSFVLVRLSNFTVLLQLLFYDGHVVEPKHFGFPFGFCCPEF